MRHAVRENRRLECDDRAVLVARGGDFLSEDEPGLDL
jgi:hypothetical protein